MTTYRVRLGWTTSPSGWDDDDFLIVAGNPWRWGEVKSAQRLAEILGPAVARAFQDWNAKVKGSRFGWPLWEIDVEARLPGEGDSAARLRKVAQRVDVRHQWRASLGWETREESPTVEVLPVPGEPFAEDVGDPAEAPPEPEGGESILSLVSNLSVTARWVAIAGAIIAVALLIRRYT